MVIMVSSSPPTTSHDAGALLAADVGQRRSKTLVTVYEHYALLENSIREAADTSRQGQKMVKKQAGMQAERQAGLHLVPAPRSCRRDTDSSRHPLSTRAPASVFLDSQLFHVGS